MKKECRNELEILLERYPTLGTIRQQIEEAFEIMASCYAGEGKLLIVGNGGSSSDAQHIVGELMKGFRSSRPLSGREKEKLCQIEPSLGKDLAGKLQQALPAIAIDGHPSLLTAFANDVDASCAYAQAVYGYGCGADVLLAISTSGNSKNILYAAVAAKARGMRVIALTAENGGELKRLADVSVCVPQEECYQAQELHLPIYHCWCLMLEQYFFRGVHKDAEGCC